MIRQRIERVDSDEIELIPKQHIRRFVPVGAVGQKARIFFAHVCDERCPEAPKTPRPAFAFDPNRKRIDVMFAGDLGPGQYKSFIILPIAGPRNFTAWINLTAPTRFIPYP